MDLKELHLNEQVLQVCLNLKQLVYPVDARVGCLCDISILFISNPSHFTSEDCYVIQWESQFWLKMNVLSIQWALARGNGEAI